MILAFVLAGACSASCGGSDTTGGSGGGSGTTTTTSTLSGPGVELSYSPGWPGVTSVSVIGDFGANGAWDPKQPFLTLTDDGSGTWRGTADVPAGEHAFLFVVNGDAEGPADTSRYVPDPLRSKVIPCPLASPTYSSSKVRPCSALTVPEPAKDAALHVTGKVTDAGAAAAGWRVELHREEDGQDHVMTNGVDSGADGAFDVAVAAGKYRVYVLHPTFYSLADTERDPLQYKQLRRAYSSVIDVAADAALDDCEVGFDFYDMLAPTGTATLPVQLSFAIAADAKDGRAAVYGTKDGSGTRVFDPWFASDYGAETTVTFDGTFNTTAADETTAAVGEAYFWGVWQRRSAGTGGLWNGQSMVFPIKFQ
ncbi:MAG: glycogen-binding domain-containing protein [Polyangiaceae bacterium]